mmetsp:Transcript_64988/g.76908  ORF Transcript_64988/g.76908 Transcript_64988/m.76908 type:complete len:291 (-) Transcript_64988:24-896(-)
MTDKGRNGNINIDQNKSKDPSRFKIFCFFLHPATYFNLKPRRFQKKGAILYFWCFCAVLTSSVTAWKLNTKKPNYYTQLNVTRNSTLKEIERSYQMLSQQYRYYLPDKSSSPDADLQFENLTKVRNVLVNKKLRHDYDRFGPDGYRAFEKESNLFYVTWLVITCLITLLCPSCVSWLWISVVMLSMIFLDWGLAKSEGNVIPAWLFPRVTEYDCIWLLRLLFPGFLNGCFSIRSFLYVHEPEDIHVCDLTLTLQEQIKKMLVLENVKSMVQNLQLRDGSGRVEYSPDQFF